MSYNCPSIVNYNFITFFALDSMYNINNESMKWVQTISSYMINKKLKNYPFINIYKTCQETKKLSLYKYLQNMPLNWLHTMKLRL